MRMAAIYARVSSEQQREENTIASQTASLIEFAQSHDLEVPKEWVFEDEGYSGATLERPGLERVRDLAAEGQIQLVLAYSPDRLSRKYAYQILLIEEFARHGVETKFVNSPQGDSAEDQLLVQFQGMIAEYERAQILERSRRGKRHRAQVGEVSVLSNAPYGYRYIRKTDEAPAAYIIDEAEARVVRRVYEMYTIEGLSIGEITRRLNTERIPTRKASRWERSVVKLWTRSRRRPRRSNVLGSEKAPFTFSNVSIRIGRNPSRLVQARPIGAALTASDPMPKTPNKKANGAVSTKLSNLARLVRHRNSSVKSWLSQLSSLGVAAESSLSRPRLLW
jgi:DNA invertase Pin-like site-specific DNA recombinase